MFQIRLIHRLSILMIIFAFVKIYQHNRIIKMNYEKQRLEMKKNEVKKNFNSLTMELCRLKDVINVRGVAQEKFGMEKLKFSQVITFTGFLAG